MDDGAGAAVAVGAEGERAAGAAEVRAGAPRARFLEGPDPAAFLAIWAGQTVSLVGGGITRFALGIWVYQETRSATLFGLVILCSTVPGMLVSPLAGSWIDRIGPTRALVRSTAAGALGMVAAALLAQTGGLGIGLAFVVMGWLVVGNAFQRPGLETLISSLVAGTHFTRANGLVQTTYGVANTLAPALAGVLLVTAGLPVILLVNAAAYAAGLAALLATPRVEPPPSSAPRTRGWSGAGEGWRYIRGRRPLLLLLLVFIWANVAMGFLQALFTPMVLTVASARTLGAVLSLGGAAMLLGSTAATLLRSPREPMAAALAAILAMGGSMALCGITPSLTLMALGYAGVLALAPIANSLYTTIWQLETPEALRGRVFATRSMLSWSIAPLAYGIAGPLADWVFEPLFANGGRVDGLAGFLPTGPGRGMAALVALTGAVTVALVVPTLASRAFRAAPSAAGVREGGPPLVRSPEST